MKFKKTLLIFITLIFATSLAEAKPKLSGKFKDWQTFTAVTENGKICFAQSLPTERAPKKFKRNKSKLFVTFRPSEDIKNEVSVTSGHAYKNSTVSAKSGKSNFSFFSQGDFAWLLDENEEKKFVKLMKRATNLMIKSKTKDGAETTDHYSMMGFTQAYNTAKKTCS